MTTVFLTGFPGFLGSELVGRLLDRYPADVTVTCLVQPKYRQMAERRAAEIERERGTDGRIRLVDGDVTVPDLGLGDDYEPLQDETVEVYHLAAVYDLGVSRKVGMEVNVEGTRNVLDFAEGCEDLDRFQYVSTCYVSGTYDGTFTEDHLQEGQQFNNYYETTKHLAEVEVQDRMADGLAATIYRPGIVVGDSTTGETQKFDGPYFVLQWILRQPRVAAVSVIGDPTAHEINLVPRDFVVDAISYLSGIEESAGKVYQLCDPDPPTIAELLDVFERETGTRLLRVPTPRSVLQRALERPVVQNVVRIEPAAIDYFVHPTQYACENTLADLDGTGIACPPFESYADRIVEFVQSHPEISSDAMV